MSQEKSFELRQLHKKNKDHESLIFYSRIKKFIDENSNYSSVLNDDLDIHNLQTIQLLKLKIVVEKNLLFKTNNACLPRNMKKSKKI